VPPPQLDLAYLTSLGFAERIETWQAGCKEELNN